ncbi:Rapid alkalinization factor [Quillaja saponaria]|uniref:Rapid alkalinization factor n=1 Tax=Quillaja saponaria TaxID=32244 RepID=A0AAD7QCV3_QUISA|nr:Rapid alkalinization factor [Quillaja saponaria]
MPESSKQKTMSSRPILIVMSSLYLTLLFLLTCFSSCNGVSVLDLNLLKKSEIDALGRRVCSKKIGECMTELEMDSETNRRVLTMQKKYISYHTLRRDMVPCDRPGASYYNCHAGQANPYSRGCDIITRCARNIKDIKT